MKARWQTAILLALLVAAVIGSRDKIADCWRKAGAWKWAVVALVSLVFLAAFYIVLVPVMQWGNWILAAF